MASLYPLYDALISINLPSEKARAVVGGLRMHAAVGVMFAGLKLL